METTTLPIIAERKWYQIWWQVWRHPGVATFQEILKYPEASGKRGLIWMATTGLVISSLRLIVFILTGAQYAQSGSGIFVLLGAFFTPVWIVIAMAIGAVIIHCVAQVFKGSGTSREMVYCFAAVQAPLTLIGVVVSLGSILGPYISALLSIISLVLTIYSLVLFVCAVGAVENIGIGKSIVVCLAPLIVLVVQYVCISLVLAPR